ncbi:MAG: transposase [Candidatus Paceibacterota bacterium]|jgi:putative transposase|nr:transposase [Candidatus Paceibacterota bacterium]
MPRNARTDVGGEIYHVINRANGRMVIFNTPEDYLLFENLLFDTKELTGMRILAYTIMPNHWHFILHPQKDGDLGIFMHRLSNAHTRKVHALTNTNGTGHLYQGRYKSFLVDSDSYFLTLLKYVERNPVRSKTVEHCEDWQWGSAWRRINGSKAEKKLIDPPIVELPHGYKKWINTPDKEDDLAVIRTSVNKSVPFGRDKWVDQMVTKFHLESTQKKQGRPKKR